MPRRKEVRIEKDGIEAKVLDIAVPSWERHGWTAVDDGSSETDSKDETVSNQAGTEVVPATEEEND